MVHFLFFLTRFQFLTAKTVLISFDNLILSIRSRSPAQRFHHSRANQTTLERQFCVRTGS